MMDQKKAGVVSKDQEKALDVIKKRGALEKLADRLDLSPTKLMETLKATAFKDCKEDAQFIAAVVVANTYGLNPLLREMTAFPGKAGGVVPVVMIDGWISLVNRHPKYNGVELIENMLPEDQTNKSGTSLESVTAKFYLKSTDHPVIVTEYMDECFDGSKGPWKQWPRRMLRHKAYIQGARVAFGFSGIYDEDEKDRILAGQAVDVVSDPVIGLKHDKNKTPVPPTTQPPVDVKPSDPQPTDDMALYGDPARFGDQKVEAEKYLKAIKGYREKMGEEKFAKVLEAHGMWLIADISGLPDLVVIGAALLTETKK